MPELRQAPLGENSHAARAPCNHSRSGSQRTELRRVERVCYKCAVQTLDAVLNDSFTGVWRDDLTAFLGGRSNEQIVALIEQLVQKNLGRPVVGATFATKSVGAVFGLKLPCGKAVVLKLFDKTQTTASLAAVHRCIARLVEARVPAPRVLSDVFVTDDGIPGAFYELLDGETRDGHAPAVRKELARVLAIACETLAKESPSELPAAPTRGDVLWPAPHRSFLSLNDDHSPEAKWMDQIGRRAQSAIKNEGLPPLPVHSDWGVKNARFRGDVICAVYDWDSLVAGSEAEMVGRASVQFTAQWEFPARLTPDAAEETAFLSDYQQARARPFTPVEHRVAKAAATYSVAQIARLELAAGIERDDGFAAMLRARST